LLALLGAHHILHVSRIRVNLLKATVYSRLGLVFEHNTLKELLVMPSEMVINASIT
jgi:hypothetical protein